MSTSHDTTGIEDSGIENPGSDLEECHAWDVFGPPYVCNDIYGACNVWFMKNGRYSIEDEEESHDQEIIL